jgi:hypothetical protein
VRSSIDRIQNTNHGMIGCPIGMKGLHSFNVIHTHIQKLKPASMKRMEISSNFSLQIVGNSNSKYEKSFYAIHLWLVSSVFEQPTHLLEQVDPIRALSHFYLNSHLLVIQTKKNKNKNCCPLACDDDLVH